MSTAPSFTPSLPEPGPQVRQAIEGQIGMLTCQVIEMGVQLQLAGLEIAQLRQALADATPSSPMQNEPSNS